MRRIVCWAIYTAVFLPVSAAFSPPTGIAADEANQPQGSLPRSTPAAGKPMQKVEMVAMADFYLRDGNAVTGKLLSEEKNQVVVEELRDSKIISTAYSKREVDTRTFAVRNIPESRYYTQLAEYFAAQTWDFSNDPDEFIQAIRCYEKAKQSLEAGGDGEKSAEIDKAIAKVERDREVWAREVESRTKLRKLEFEAEFENRMKRTDDLLAESSRLLAANKEYFDKLAVGLKGDYDKIQSNLNQLNRDFTQQVNYLQQQMQENRAAINELWLRLTAPAFIPPRQ